MTRLSLTDADVTTTPFMGKAGEQQDVNSVAGTSQAVVYNHYRELETIWRKMETAGHCTVFQTYDWVSCWYDAAASCGEAEPVIVVVSQEGIGPVWILPLCLYKKKNVRIISFADLGLADYTAPVLAPRAPTDPDTVKGMIKAVFNVLPPCDLINFQKLADKVEGVTNPLTLLRGLKRFPVSCHGIRLDGPWPEQAEKIMQRRMRSTIRRQREKLKKHGDVAFNTHNTPETIGPVMDKLMAMRRARFETMGIPAMPPMWEKFYYDLATKKSRSLEASIATMSVSGQVLAMCFGLTKGKTFYGIIPTFEIGKWEHFRPGKILFYDMINKMSERTNGEGYFDFTVGDETYKKRFGCETHPLYEWMVPQSAMGLGPYIIWRAKLIIRRHPRLMSFLKKGLANFKKR